MFDVGSDCWFTPDLDATCTSLKLPGDLWYDDAWEHAIRFVTGEEDYAEGSEGKSYLVDEDIRALMAAGFRGSVVVDPDDGDQYHVDFHAQRFMEYTDAEHDVLGQLLKACFQEKICSSCRHRVRCSLGEYADRWQPGDDVEGIDVLRVAVPTGIEVRLPDLVVLGREAR